MYTEQKALNGTAFDDVFTVASMIATYTIENGGGTFNANTGEVITDFDINDYIVGGAQVGRVRKINDRDLVEGIAAHIQHIPFRSNGEKRYFLGTWIDAGLVFIDSSEIVNGFENALKLAMERGEVAIFDPNTEESFYL